MCRATWQNRGKVDNSVVNYLGDWILLFDVAGRVTKSEADPHAGCRASGSNDPRHAPGGSGPIVSHRDAEQ